MALTKHAAHSKEQAGFAKRRPPTRRQNIEGVGGLTPPPGHESGFSLPRMFFFLEPESIEFDWTMSDSDGALTVNRGKGFQGLMPGGQMALNRYRKRAI